MSETSIFVPALPAAAGGLISLDVFKHGFTRLGTAREALIVDALDILGCKRSSLCRQQLEQFVAVRPLLPNAVGRAALAEHSV